ncbi:uncharacterized protein PV09_02279 [Verruconis gallopava]|uniref:Uncharacterized protein n=1 Tax=Verruconis gallopava TaxID=253628 RepID=A0A0D2B8A5_9PEZI|nr:uncharacterized protein PV09_02279 [Verruconis gallopava]KIW07439.1 hypothetical protein PV09_02279 [Verruconis gallopava]
MPEAKLTEIAYTVVEEHRSHGSQAINCESIPLRSSSYVTAPHLPNGKKNEKQLHRDEEGKSGADRADVAGPDREGNALASHAREKSPSLSAKIYSWDMDPDSRPPSRNGSFRPSKPGTWLGVSTAAGGEKSSLRHRKSRHRKFDAVDGACSRSGIPISSTRRKASSHISHNANDDKRFQQALFFSSGSPEEERVMPHIKQDWLGLQDSSSKASVARHSHHSFTTTSPKVNTAGLMTIPEGYLLEKHTLSATLGELSDSNTYPHLNQASSSCSGQFPGNFLKKNLEAPAKQVQPFCAGPKLYRAPTVEDVPEGWNGWEQNELKQHTHSQQTLQSYSRKKKGVNHWEKMSIPNHSYGNRSSIKQDPLNPSLQSDSAEKVDQWINFVPPPDEQTIFREISKRTRSTSHIPRYSRSNDLANGWKNRSGSSNASLGTGYGRRGVKESNATARAAVWGQGQDWDKMTTAGSSTKAEVGMRRDTVRSWKTSSHNMPLIDDTGQW